MGCRCDRCGYEWIPRDLEVEPEACPKCKSPYWNKPRRHQKATPMTSYDEFRAAIESTLKTAREDLTWTEIRTLAKLPQLFPNNQWVHRLETDIKLHRKRDANGIIKWGLG